MKIIDTKNIDVGKVNKQFEEFEKTLKECDSFKSQQKEFIEMYNERTFQRDILVRRKLQLDRIMKYDFGEITLWIFGMFIPQIADNLTFSSDQKVLAGICSFFAYLFLAKKISSLLIKEFKEPEIALYDIHNYELTFLNAVLKSGKEEIDVPDFLKELELKQK